MVWRRSVVAIVAAGAVIVSAPFAQQLFTAVSTSWGPQSRPLGIAATVVPIGVALVVAVARIRERRTVRYLTLCSSVLLGAAYVAAGSLSFTECFHFAEYGLLTWLFYRWVMASDLSRAPAGERPSGPPTDGSVLVVPILASLLVGTADEWFQWFVPIRAGEARDIGLDVVASLCGLLFSLSIEPPGRLGINLNRRSRPRVSACAVACVVALAFFFVSVHLGHEVQDPRVGTFRARYTATRLAELSQDRAAQWTVDPPVAQRPLSREDQYLAEGLWRVRRRNLAWEDGDVSTAWRENLILETYYAPILDTPTFASEKGHRWPADQRADAYERPGVDYRPRASDEYRYPLFVWSDLF
jgi:hypothetical protein